MAFFHFWGVGGAGGRVAFYIQLYELEKWERRGEERRGY